jgi:Holliday junction resolvasome RuvABC endonuclease subunit
MRVLAIDASLRNCGVAIVDGENGKSRALFFGTIHNASSLKSSACLVAIRNQLAQLIREHEPDCCALEAVIYVQSYNQTSDGWDRCCQKGPSCVHDASLARVNRNARSRFG